VASVAVNLVFEPPWTPARMSDEAKLELNML
jgi:metal-sulfur cluster biosynthetic enzyme